MASAPPQQSAKTRTDRAIVLSVAGSDCSAGAGIQADLKTIEACGARAMTVITAVTSQNGLGVHHVEPVAPSAVQAQLEAVFSGYPVAAVKSGMLGASATVGVLARRLAQAAGVPYVCDPVLAASDGSPLLDAKAVPHLRRELLPRATLVTPNTHELACLTGMAVVDLPSAEQAARRLLEDGPGAVLVTGGHLSDRPGTDILVTGQGRWLLPGDYVDTPHTHGTGCVYAAAIAAALAAGAELLPAVRSAKALVRAAIRNATTPGVGRGAVDPGAARSAETVQR